jgi:hypothetical protein
MFLIVASFTIVIYERNMFIGQAMVGGCQSIDDLPAGANPIKLFTVVISEVSY